MGAAHRLPGAAPRHGDRCRIPSRHRPGPGQLHHRPAHRPRPARHADVITDTADLIGGIGRAVLDDLHPPRRPRTSVRKVKSPLSRYNKKDPYRPERSTPITGLTVTIGDPETKDTTREPKCSTTDLGP